MTNYNDYKIIVKENIRGEVVVIVEYYKDNVKVDIKRSSNPNYIRKIIETTSRELKNAELIDGNFVSKYKKTNSIEIIGYEDLKNNSLFDSLTVNFEKIIEKRSASEKKSEKKKVEKKAKKELAGVKNIKVYDTDKLKKVTKVSKYVAAFITTTAMLSTVFIHGKDLFNKIINENTKSQTTVSQETDAIYDLSDPELVTINKISPDEEISVASLEGVLEEVTVGGSEIVVVNELEEQINTPDINVEFIDDTMDVNTEEVTNQVEDNVSETEVVIDDQIDINVVGVETVEPQVVSVPAEEIIEDNTSEITSYHSIVPTHQAKAYDADDDLRRVLYALVQHEAGGTKDGKIDPEYHYTDGMAVTSTILNRIDDEKFISYGDTIEKQLNTPNQYITIEGIKGLDLYKDQSKISPEIRQAVDDCLAGTRNTEMTCYRAKENKKDDRIQYVPGGNNFFQPVREIKKTAEEDVEKIDVEVNNANVSQSTKVLEEANKLAQEEQQKIEAERKAKEAEEKAIKEAEAKALEEAQLIAEKASIEAEQKAAIVEADKQAMEQATQIAMLQASANSTSNELLMQIKLLDPNTPNFKDQREALIDAAVQAQILNPSATDDMVMQLYGYTPEQLDVIKSVICHEAGGNNITEIANVTSCVMNRVNSNGSNPYAVLTASGQFESYYAGGYKAYSGHKYGADVDIIVDAILARQMNCTHDYLNFKSHGSPDRTLDGTLKDMIEQDAGNKYH